MSTQGQEDRVKESKHKAATKKTPKNKNKTCLDSNTRSLFTQLMLSSSLIFKISFFFSTNSKQFLTLSMIII